jgi:hypothetical protein
MSGRRGKKKPVVVVVEEPRISPVIVAYFPETEERQVLRLLMAGHHPRQVQEKRDKLMTLDY